MFGIFRKEEKSIYDEAIEKTLDDIHSYDPVDPEFASALNQLERLTKLKAESRKGRISPDTKAVVFANLVGILIIVGYEQKHVVTSKAMGFISRPKEPHI